MKIFMLAAVAVMGLAGCETEAQKKAQALEDVKTAWAVCESTGLTPKTEPFMNCALSYAQNLQQQRLADSQARSARLAALSQQFYAADAQRQSYATKMTSTTCTPMGRSVHCTSY